ncbi:MAG: hypothetical protein KAW92_15320 [Candidatus Cloacimonetes bacterium]|nr:hypothetical protein [Candidatus Cloacimonadota bacterium]
MREKLLIFLIIALITLISCSLDRSNPLDPIGNPEIFSPPSIDSLWIYNWMLTWNVGIEIENDSIYFADGYYVYGAIEYYGKYDKLSTEHDTTYSIEDAWYDLHYRWFKVSSYIVFSDTLEGHLSKPITK